MGGWLRAQVAQVDRLWFVCAVMAAGLVLASAGLPFWTMDLTAPQYPAGLELVAYGTHIEGDLEELNTLNHYVGVERLEPHDIFELQLFPFAIAGLSGALLLGSVFARHRLLRVALALATWAFAVGLLLDVQWWLYRTGHELDENAAMRIPEFTPSVLGGSQVVNFHSDAMVAAGFWLIVAAAALVSFGPMVTRFLVESWRNTGDDTPTRATPPRDLTSEPAGERVSRRLS
jgi:copper chaperone NosL